MKTFQPFIIATIVLAFIGFRAIAGENEKASPLDPIKALAGKWEEQPTDGSPASVVEFKVTSAGGSVVETMFPGQPHEMVNVYTVDGESIIVTHYCASKNAPRMRLTKNENGAMLFEFIDGANITPEKSYMGKLELIIGTDEIEEKWTSITDGKEEGQMAFKMKRVKD
ncbi:MAG TPA: hypothetical protein PK402_03005 [Tepidisphaeraceae bacterium]|nr:hypothetical protein [Tepidisphaeraceae bacterium]